MGQGQPREIIWTILVVLTYTMLHTKFQGHRSIVSGEEDFFRFLPYMGMAAILVTWPEPFEPHFVPPIPGDYIWNLVTIGPVVSEEKSFEIVDGRRRTTTDDGACLYYKLPRSLWLRWAKKPPMSIKQVKKVVLLTASIYITMKWSYKIDFFKFGTRMHTMKSNNSNELWLSAA